MIRHIVIWQLASSDPAAKIRDVRTIRDLLVPLQTQIEGIRSLRVDANGAPYDTNFDVALTSDFDDLAALARYQQHPLHLAAAAQIKQLVTARAAVDFEV